MAGCANCGSGAGPHAEGKELVEFVYQAHGGSLRNQPLPDGGLITKCQGCGGDFILSTFVGLCPHCSGVHAVSPPRANNADNIQYAGDDFEFPN